ncbi:MAG: DUF2063 domain-containing protein [Gammaproteobacteria bacterium]|nr:DUF2063 domain-containing protein [Gammaproteobacteria bacterium]
MPLRGENLPNYRVTQLAFAAHIRNPAVHPAPLGIEPRRMQIYVDLVYNNIERFLANTFRIIRSLTSDAAWHAMVRDFVHRHRSASPFFQEIPREFLAYLETERESLHDEVEPPWLLELAHYEWVELALDLDQRSIPERDVDPGGDLLDGYPVVSPLAWLLSYEFPVHRISKQYQPAIAPDQPTFLVVYRDRAERVRFLEVNRVTARLLSMLRETDVSGRAALTRIGLELAGHDREAVERGGLQMLEQLRDCAIIAGVRTVDD